MIPLIFFLVFLCDIATPSALPFDLEEICKRDLPSEESEAREAPSESAASCQTKPKMRLNCCLWTTAKYTFFSFLRLSPLPA